MDTISGIYNIDGSPIAPETAQRFMQIADESPGLKVVGAPQHGAFALVSPGKAFGPHSATLGSGARQSWVVLDGRIDNQEDLRSALDPVFAEQGIAAKDASDAEWVLAAYRRWGMDCPDQLIGDYAFALWDADKQRLLAARDPMKFRQLFYTFDGKRFAFASDPEILLEGLCLPRTFDQIYLVTFLSTDGLNWERSPYEAVKQITAGWKLTVDRNGLRTDRWWDLPEAESLRYKNYNDYLEHLRSLYYLAVKARMRTKKKVGIALSRGIDSCSVAAEALNVMRNGDSPCAGVQGITFGLKTHPEGDESPQAEAIARHLGLDQITMSDEGRPLIGDYRPMMKSCFEPTSFYNINFWDPLREGCEQTDCDVILDGDGGGHLFGGAGFRTLSDLMFERRYGLWLRDFWTQARAGTPPWRMIKETILKLKRPEARWTHMHDSPWVLDPDLCRPIPPSENIAHPFNRAVHHSIVNACTVNFGTERGVFRSNGIELLHPIWDRRITEFSYQLPISHKYYVRIPDGSYLDKPVQRRAFERELPLDLTKTNAPINGYFGERYSQAWHILNEILGDPPASLKSLVDLNSLRQKSFLLRRDVMERRPVTEIYGLACWLAVHEVRK